MMNDSYILTESIIDTIKNMVKSHKTAKPKQQDFTSKDILKNHIKPGDIAKKVGSLQPVTRSDSNHMTCSKSIAKGLCEELEKINYGTLPRSYKFINIPDGDKKYVAMEITANAKDVNVTEVIAVLAKQGNSLSVVPIYTGGGISNTVLKCDVTKLVKSINESYDIISADAVKAIFESVKLV